MTEATEALLTIRQTMKFYDSCLEGVRRRHGLSRIEVVIMSFLGNNPGFDSVGEISGMRMLSKGNVSRGADSLCRRGLLERCPDREDRRAVHLLLTPQAAPIVNEIEDAARQFARQAFRGFEPGELGLFRDYNRRLRENLGQDPERSGLSDGNTNAESE